jgi:hypothetical protein
MTPGISGRIELFLKAHYADGQREAGVPQGLVKYFASIVPVDLNATVSLQVSAGNREVAAIIVAGRCLIPADNRAAWSAVAAETRKGRLGSLSTLLRTSC